MLNKEFLQNNKRQILNIFSMFIINIYMIYNFNNIIKHNYNIYDKNNTIAEWNTFNISYMIFVLSSVALYAYLSFNSNISKESKILNEINNISYNILYVMIYILGTLVNYNYFVLLLFISFALFTIYEMFRKNIWNLFLLISNKEGI